MFEVPHRDSPGGPVVKNPPCNAGDMGSIAGWQPKIPYAVKWSKRANKEKENRREPIK